MPVASTHKPVLVLLGAVSGLLAGMLGVGGGLVVGPVLMMMGIPMSRAFGIALAVILPVATVAVITEGLVAAEHFHLYPALLLAIGGQLGVHLAGRLHGHIPESSVRWAFLALVVYASLRNLGLFGDLPGQALPGLAAESSAMLVILSLGLGVLAGMCAVFFGVGGGIVVVPGLVLAVGGFSVRDAMATSLMAMVPTSAIGLRLAVRAHRVEASTALALMPTALLGSVGGVLLRDFVIEPAQLAQLFGLFLLFVALRLGTHKTSAKV
jgi:uncharacterized protein